MLNPILFLLEVNVIILFCSVITTFSMPMGGSIFGNIFSSRRTFTQDSPFLLVNGAARASNDFARTALRLQPSNFPQQYDLLHNQNRNSPSFPAMPLSGEKHRVPLRHSNNEMINNNSDLPMSFNKNEPPEEVFDVKTINDNKLLIEHIFETTTWPTDATEYWDTTDYESTTPDDLLRSGVPDAVAASLLGK